MERQSDTSTTAAVKKALNFFKMRVWGNQSDKKLTEISTEKLRFAVANVSFRRDRVTPLKMCGVYKATDCPPLIETDAVKADAGHVGVEEALSASGLPWASFRPQYITGYGSNKDCEEWFFDRIARGRPVPIPGSGDLMCSISNAEDLGAMMCLAVGNPKAMGIFNCVHNKGITHDGMVRLCAKVMAVDCPPIVHYNPSEVGGKKAFLFRPVHFYAQPVAATSLLGWAPKWNLEETLAQRWELYKELGRDKKDIDFSLDDEILAHCEAK